MNLLIGVTASSGVADLPLYLRIFRERLQADIKLVATPSVYRFISREFLQVYVGGQLYDDFFAGDDQIKIPHTDLSRWADAFIILPCTANTIAKAAQGMADNLLTMLILYYPKRVIFFPNMNPEMWSKKVVQANVSKLLADDHRVVMPSWNGFETATGAALDSGHMPPPIASAEYIKEYVMKNDAEKEVRA